MTLNIFVMHGLDVKCKVAVRAVLSFGRWDLRLELRRTPLRMLPN